MLNGGHSISTTASAAVAVALRAVNAMVAQTFSPQTAGVLGVVWVDKYILLIITGSCLVISRTAFYSQHHHCPSALSVIRLSLAGLANGKLLLDRSCDLCSDQI